MYKSFILPLFDYADIVWDNCTDTQSKMLENLHLEAIRSFYEVYAELATKIFPKNLNLHIKGKKETT